MATASNETANVYQFKVGLKRAKPPIWRRIQVPDSYNFYELHVAIQCAMGWSNSHLHQFNMKNPRTKVLETLGQISGPGDEYQKNEKHAKIASYFTGTNKKGEYVYDLGSSWDHEVLLERIIPAEVNMTYPRCIGGRQGCPLEDGTESEVENFVPKKFNPKLVHSLFQL